MKNSFSYQLARFISYICHPLLMPTYGILLVFNSNTYLERIITANAEWMIVGLVFFTTFIMPLIYALFSLKQGLINSLHMETREERYSPFLYTTLLYFGTYYLIKQLNISPIINMLFIGASVAIFLAWVINYKWKISAHMIGIGGIIGASLGIYYKLDLAVNLYLLGILFLAGFVGFARLKMNAHSSAQVYAGFTLGILSQLVLLLFV